MSKYASQKRRSDERAAKPTPLRKKWWIRRNRIIGSGTNGRVVEDGPAKWDDKCGHWMRTPMLFDSQEEALEAADRMDREAQASGTGGWNFVYTPEIAQHVTPQVYL